MKKIIILFFLTTFSLNSQILSEKNRAVKINEILKSFFKNIQIQLVDFKLEFGYDANKNLLLADELSPDGMRLWKEGKSFDKDLFRKEEGSIVDAYKYILSELKGINT